jgi:transposase
MTEILTLTHERVDDIPLLIGLERRLGLPELLDQCLGNHGLHQGLSNGVLATAWMAFIASESDHRKSTVQDWAERHRQTLEQLLGQPIRSVEFTDDRLGIVLRRLSRTAEWEALEAELWAKTVAVYGLDQGMTGVRLDSTTASGYHTPTEDGVMQFGHSKDHRPDLPQLKVMAAGVEPSGHLLACDVLSGQSADDPLYQPLIARVRQVLGRTGLLYSGDCKMAALATRAEVVAHGDYYLTVLPLTGQTRAEFDTWVARAVDSGDPSLGSGQALESVELLWDGERLLGAGYEFERQLKAEVEAQTVEWTERVQVVRSRDLALQQAKQLTERLCKAEAALLALTPEPGRGKRQYCDEAALRTAIAEVEAQYRVRGLLQVTWRREEESVTRYVGRGRGGPNRPTRTEVTVRYVVTDVQRDEEAVAKQRHRLGWRVQVTNLPQAKMTLTQTVIHYRGGWSLERDFHLVKDRPLGISPLYVRDDDQIIGLTRLLSLALRLLTLIEIKVRQGLAETKETLAGLYEGQASRVTDRPTATRLLKAFARAELTLTRVELGGPILWHITPLSALLERILAYLDLPRSLYDSLAVNSS